MLRILRRGSEGRGQDRVRQMAEERGPKLAPLRSPFFRVTLRRPGRCLEEGALAQTGTEHPPLRRLPLEGRRSSLEWKGGGYPGPRPPAASGLSPGVWGWFGRRLWSLWRRRRRLRGSSSWGRGPPGAPRRQEIEAAAGAGAGGAPGRAAHGGDGALGGGPAGPAGGRVGTQMRP